LRKQIKVNNDYEYVGVPLTPSIAQELIKEAFSGKTATRREIVEIVVQIHDERGGLPSEAKSVKQTILSALQVLQAKGLAACISGWRWQINPSSDHPEIEQPDIPDEEEIIEPDAPSEIGSGDGKVYLYYFPLYREMAESKGESVWPCKIGRTEGDPVLRVRSQAATAIPEEPEIALTIRTDVPPDMEKAIHAILAISGRHIEKAQGREWFRTCPREVEAIHAFIMAIMNLIG
jgi:hypothetical protein